MTDSKQTVERRLGKAFLAGALNVAVGAGKLASWAQDQLKTRPGLSLAIALNGAVALLLWFMFGDSSALVKFVSSLF